MDREGIRIRARLDLLTAEAGGRTVPLSGSYRPNHNFFGPNDRDMAVGFIDLPTGTELRPGESAEVVFTLWPWSGLDGEVYPGRRWRIQEGAKLVGMGTVLEVLSDAP